MIKQKTNLKQTTALRKKQPKPKTKSNLLIKPFNRNKRNRPSKNQKKKRTKTKTKYNKKTQKLQKCLKRENNMMKKWTPKDEKLLLQLVRTEKFCDWDFVSSHFEEFEPKHCFKRYRQLKKIESIKGAWNSIEDELLKKAILEFGERNWAYVSNFVPARSSKQCRERWKNQLRPGINHTPFTSFEERLLIEKQREFGNKWSQISKYFNGRPDNMLKNIYHSICTRRGINCHNRFDEKKKCKKKKFKKKIIVIGKKRTVTNTNHAPLDMKGSIKKEMECRKLKSTNLAGIFFPNTPQKKYKVKKGSTKKHLKIKPYKKNKKKKLNNNLEKKKSKQNEKKKEKEKENKKKKEKGKEKNIDSLKHNKEMIKFQKYHINNQKTPNKNDYHLQYGQRTNKDTTRLENHNKKLQQEKHYELSRSDSENDININSNSKKKINQYYQKNPKTEIDKIKNKLKDKKNNILEKIKRGLKKKKKNNIKKREKIKTKRQPKYQKLESLETNIDFEQFDKIIFSNLKNSELSDSLSFSNSISDSDLEGAMEIECITDQKYYTNKTKNRPKKKKQEKSQKHKINLKNIDKLNELEKRINDVNTSNSDNTGNEKIENNEKLESDDNNDNNEKQEMTERTQSVLIPTQKQFNLSNNLSPLSPKSYPYWKQYSWYNKLDQICEKDLIRLEFQSPPSSLPFQKNEDNLHKNNDNFLNIGNGISMEIEEIPNFETPNSLKSSNCSSNENSNLIFWGKNFNKDINQPSFNEDVSFNFDFFNQDSDVPPDIFFF